MAYSRILLLCFAVLTLCAGCKGKSVVNPTNVVVPIGRDEARRFGLQLETAILQRDTAKAIKLISLPHFVYRCRRELGMPEELNKSLWRSAESNNSGQRTAENWMGEPGQQDVFKLLHVRLVNDRPHLIFRSTVSNLDYLDMTLYRASNGDVIMDDYLMASDEEQISDFYRFSLREFPDGPNKVTQENKHSQTLNDLVEFKLLVNKGKYAEAWKEYEKLPEEVKGHRQIHMYAILVLLKVNPPAANPLLTSFRLKYPEDLGYDLSRLYNLIDNKKCDEAQDIINRVDERYGPDAYLALLRAQAFHAVQRYDEAEKALAAGLKREPTQLDLHWYRIMKAVEAAKFNEAVGFLKALVEVRPTGVDVTAIEADKRFATLMNSEQYKEFKKWLSERKPK